MKTRYLPWVAVLTILCVALLSLKLYATYPLCENLWNFCQGTCHGTPILVVYPNYLAVECTNAQSPCLPHWGPHRCE